MLPSQPVSAGGPACGLIKAFALAARVTHYVPVPVARVYREAVAAVVAAAPAGGSHYVMLNGDIVGPCCDPERTAAAIRRVSAELAGLQTAQAWRRQAQFSATFLPSL